MQRLTIRPVTERRSSLFLRSTADAAEVVATLFRPLIFPLVFGARSSASTVVAARSGAGYFGLVPLGTPPKEFVTVSVMFDTLPNCMLAGIDI